MVTIVPDCALVPPYAGESLQMQLVVLTDPPNTPQAATDAPWIIGLSHTSIGPGVDSLTFSATSNPGSSRSDGIRVWTPNAETTATIRQFAGQNTQSQIDEILVAPMIMEFGIATKFIASEIAKLPPPAQLVAIAAVEALYPVLAAALNLAREGFAGLPTGPPIFGVPPIPIPVTTQCVLLQTIYQEVYLPIAVAEAE